MSALFMILAWLVFGFVVGAIARALYPGTQPMGLLGTAALGVVGSFVGGLVGNLLFHAPVFYFHPAGIVGSIVGALLVMAIAGFSLRTRTA